MSYRMTETQKEKKKEGTRTDEEEEGEEGRGPQGTRALEEENERGRGTMGLLEDEAKVAELLELNGMPRWVAFEERFIVAEREGEVLAAVRYRTEPKRLLLGLLVADPWAGERRLAVDLYAGARRLPLGASDIVTRIDRCRAAYPYAAE